MKTKEGLEAELQGLVRQSAKALGVHQRCEGAVFVLRTLIANYDVDEADAPPPPPPPPPTKAELAHAQGESKPGQGNSRGKEKAA